MFEKQLEYMNTFELNPFVPDKMLSWQMPVLRN